MYKANVINVYMEHAKTKTILYAILGVQEMMNAPLKTVYLLLPLGVFLFAMKKRELLMVSAIPNEIHDEYESIIIILLISMFIMLVLAIIVSIGRKLHDEESAIIADVFRKEHNGKLELIYKRKKADITIRKFYTHIEKGKWNEHCEDILQRLNAHFVEERFHYEYENSLIIIMRTANGIEKQPRTEWRDDELERDLEDMRYDPTRF